MNNETQQKSPSEWIEQKLLQQKNILKNHFEEGKWNDDRCSEIDNCLEFVQQAKEMEKAQSEVTENTSDGYHTFKILYAIRKAYNVALFNEWGSQIVEEKKLGGAIIKSIKYHVHKSRRHHDGELPFGKDDWFIVCAMLPTGQISNHYPIEDWDLFQIPETKKALFPFDGHTTEDVIERLLSIK
jgi:hypothetical protein